MRRRLRQQRRMREALLLDLGALVYELHRHGRREPELLQAKAAELTAVDQEVRGLADALDDDESVLTLVAAGIAGSCERCGSLLSTDARYCGACGAAAVAAITDPARAPAGPALPGPEVRDPAPVAGSEPGTEPAAARDPDPEPEQETAATGLAEQEPIAERERVTNVSVPPNSIHDQPYADEPADPADAGADPDRDEPIAPWLVEAEPPEKQRSDG